MTVGSSKRRPCAAGTAWIRPKRASRNHGFIFIGKGCLTDSTSQKALYSVNPFASWPELEGFIGPSPFISSIAGTSDSPKPKNLPLPPPQSINPFPAPRSTIYVKHPLQSTTGCLGRSRATRHHQPTACADLCAGHRHAPKQDRRPACPGPEKGLPRRHRQEGEGHHR